jgi:hypothetical protein
MLAPAKTLFFKKFRLPDLELIFSYSLANGRICIMIAYLQDEKIIKYMYPILLLRQGLSKVAVIGEKL